MSLCLFVCYYYLVRPLKLNVHASTYVIRSFAQFPNIITSSLVGIFIYVFVHVSDAPTGDGDDPDWFDRGNRRSAPWPKRFRPNGGGTAPAPKLGPRVGAHVPVQQRP